MVAVSCLPAHTQQQRLLAAAAGANDSPQLAVCLSGELSMDQVLHRQQL
jgi:hypothetical protein